jgi:enterochelin esterase family protein
LPDDWRGSYFLMPADATQAPPASPREIRPWWIELMRTSAVADGFNPRAAHRGGGGQPLSAIVLPGAGTHPAWQAPDRALRGDLHMRRWRSERLRNEREVWLYRTRASTMAAADDGAAPLVVLLDGHHWARHMPLFGALDALTAAGQLPPAVYLLVDALGPAQRARELPCNAAFWLALQDELLPAMRRLQPFSADPHRTLVAGQSFGGLAALYAALHWPRRFGMALSQSGSFWWPEANEHGAVGWLTRQVRAGLGAGAALILLLEVGCYETDMIDDNRAMHTALLAAGHRANYREFRGGHDWLCWRDGLLHGLVQLLNDAN